MKVISLVAGVSSRLMPLTADRHKSQLDVAGRPLIRWQLDAFEAAGISEIVFITGHHGEQIRELGPSYGGISLRYIDNPKYSSRNINYSLYLAREEAEGRPFICFEGDLLLHPGILRSLITAPHENCIVVDPEPKSSMVDTLVVGRNDRVERLWFADHQDLRSALTQPGVSALGELVCAVRFGAAASRFLFDSLARSSFEGRTTLYDLISQSFKVCETGYVTVGPHPWVEIDTAQDLERAHSLAAQMR